MIINRRLHFVAETLRVRDRYGFTEIRFVETYDACVPPSSVPDFAFNPSDLDSRLRNSLGGFSAQNGVSGISTAITTLVQTEVAALYQLNKPGADVSEPIQVIRTLNACILVTGIVASDALKG